MKRLAVPALCCGLLLAGCGSSSPSDQLRDKVAAVTDAANGRNPDALVAAADDLIATVTAQHDGGKLNLDRYRAIRNAALKVKADAGLLRSPAPTSAPTVAPTKAPATTAPAAPAPSTGKGKHGKGGGKHDDGSPSPSIAGLLPTAGPTTGPTAGPSAGPSAGPTAVASTGPVASPTP